MKYAIFVQPCPGPDSMTLTAEMERPIHPYIALESILPPFLKKAL